jgi:uncharacterized protein (UPF0261 family)
LALGALDTKGHELAFLKEQIEQRGHQTRVVDVGVLGEPAFPPSVTRAEVAAAGGRESGDPRRKGPPFYR